MWLLVLVWLTVNPVTLQEFEDHAAILSVHQTLGEFTVPIIDEEGTAQQPSSTSGCAAWRNYVGYEMARAYPNERDFTIVCQYQRPPYY